MAQTLVMKVLFADSFYWIALLCPKDQWHQRVKDFNRNLKAVHFVTTDEVLTEFLNFFSGYNSTMRQGAIRRVRDMLQSHNVQVIPQTRERFLASLDLYEQRLDKEYSLTDCISMQVMKEMGITDVLTHDHHFAQEGFMILFP
jgi:predicted nucleic acid-binding protein